MYFGQSDQPKRQPLSFLIKQREAFDMKYQVSQESQSIKSKLSYVSISTRDRDPQVQLEQRAFVPYVRERGRFGNMLPTMEQIKENKKGEDEVYIASNEAKYPSIFSHNSIPTELSRTASILSQQDEEAKRYETPLRSERNVVSDLR